MSKTLPPVFQITTKDIDSARESYLDAKQKEKDAEREHIAMLTLSYLASGKTIAHIANGVTAIPLGAPQKPPVVGADTPPGGSFGATRKGQYKSRRR